MLNFKQKGPIFSGTISIFDPGISPIKLLHKAAINVRIDGFFIKSMAIFEDPLTAIVQLQYNGPHQSFWRRHVADTLDDDLIVTLTLTDRFMAGVDADLTYTIDRKGQSFRRLSPQAMTVMNRMASKIVQSLTRSISNSGTNAGGLLLAH